jgi:hypothetical protein
MLTAALGLLYVVLAPASADLAAAAYRSDLFARAGFTLWDNDWYGGHHLPAYSTLAPALGALLGPRLLAAVSATIAAALFAALLDGRFAPRTTRIAGCWFALGAGVELLSGRVPFTLGLTLALGALLAAQRARRAGACALAVLSALASPVAAAFLALVALAWALARRRTASASASASGSVAVRAARATHDAHAGVAISLACAALIPIALLELVFPEGGSEPFATSSFLPAFAAVVALAVFTPRRRRLLRGGALLYALALALAYLLPTAVGGNAVRLGALTAGPLAVCMLAGAGRRRRNVLIVLAPLLLYWQLVAPVHDFASAAGDPAVHAAYYAPLLDRLGVLDGGRPVRIEVPPTFNHWEARWLAPRVALARGWVRQLDRARNPLFYDSATLDAARYERWLAANAIAYVALPSARLDSSAQAEAKLLAAPPPYLRELWHSPHWRLFAVLDARPLASPPALLSSLGSDSFTLAGARSGEIEVRVRFTPYWAIEQGHGCVRRAAGGWTRLDLRSGGRVRVGIDFAPGRIFDHGPRCRR